MINFFICLLSYWSPVWLWWFEEEFIFHFYEKFYFCSHIGLQYDNKIFKFCYICFLFVFLLIYNDWLWSPAQHLATLSVCFLLSLRSTLGGLRPFHPRAPPPRDARPPPFPGRAFSLEISCLHLLSYWSSIWQQTTLLHWLSKVILF